MAHGPLFFFVALTTASTAMALPRAYVKAIGVEEESISLAYNGDVYETSECRNDVRTCRETGKCKLDNSGYVCCCDYCSNSRRPLNKSTNFCGDDGVTYTSHCEYRRQKCIQNKPIEIAHKGQCNATCAQLRNATLYKQAVGEEPYGYVPECQQQDTNMYELTQCSMTDGRKCWCVMPESNHNITQPVPVEHPGELNCEQELKIATLTCDPCHIIKEIFKAFPGANNYDSYYAKHMEQNQRYPRTDRKRSDYGGVATKLFSMFDRNTDELLSRSEVDVISRWLNLSSICVRDTLNICDDDEDDYISPGEWCSCLMNRFKCPELDTPRNVRCG